VVVGSDVFIGYGSIIMPGVRIGNRCVVGAGSVVTKSVPDGTVVVGNPAHAVRSYEALMGSVARWTTDADLDGIDFRRRVQMAVDSDFAPDMKRPDTHHERE